MYKFFRLDFENAPWEIECSKHPSENGEAANLSLRICLAVLFHQQDKNAGCLKGHQSMKEGKH
ncbi:MAG: hypothetical protein IPN95_05565 [Bacteroidetes bacterium]|nr:hypothetical protein [Bacteroidota bacterium]